MKDNGIIRIRVISFGVILVALVLILKLYLVQVVHSEEYKNKADRQYVRGDQAVFDRGSIFFQTKDGDKIAAATLDAGYILAIDPRLVTDINSTYEKINAIYPLEKEDFVTKANKKSDPYEELAKRVPLKEGEDINALKLPGVRIYKDRWRYYPGNSTAANLLGFLGYRKDSADKLVGQYGLERQYESVLSRASSNVFANFFVEIFSNLNKAVIDKQDLEGDVILTIEPTVQNALEKTIKGVEDSYKSKSTGGVVMDPKTGDIIAMASFPTFDPNNYKDASLSSFKNPIVEDVYEMGSILKPITMAAGLDAGVVTPETTYNDKGFMTLDTATFYNYDKKGRGVVSMQTVLDKSLNTGVAYVVSKLGKDKFRDYFYKFGIAEKTNIDLPNEATPLVSNLKSPRDIEYATASFGQGIAISPIQMVRALAALGNGGYLVTPHVTKKIEYKIGIPRVIDPPKGQQIISEQTSKTITGMLIKVVDSALLEGKVKMDHYSQAAKTGTAQIADGHGKYYSDRYLHSFFGYFPATNPRFIIFLYTIEPQGVEYASHSLTVPYSDLAKYLINYYEVPPDR